MKKSSVLVFVQFSCLGYFVVSGSLIAEHWILVSFQILAVLLGLWSVWSMGFGTLSVFPEPKEAGTLIERGPYRIIRHPMYTAVLAFCFSLFLTRLVIIDGVVFSILLTNQVMKLRFEESLLEKRYLNYADYRQRTFALIPFVY